MTQYTAVTWVERGVLKMLSYPTRVAAAAKGLDPVTNPGALRMSGGAATIEEMIASTTRGIYVTRFSNVTPISGKTLYLTAYTYAISRPEIAPGTQWPGSWPIAESSFCARPAIQALASCRICASMTQSHCSSELLDWPQHGTSTAPWDWWLAPPIRGTWRPYAR